MPQHLMVSIIIVNYNGRHLLEECLTAIFGINYPKNLYEVIVVDNNSQDDSVDYIRNHFPKVKLIESIQNLGFAGGNNLAITNAKGDLFVCVNSDTKVDKNWLKYLVDSSKEKNVGAVSSKLRYYTPFIKLTIQSETHLKANLYKSNDFSPLGLIVEEIKREGHPAFSDCWYSGGFYQPKKGNLNSRWTNGNGEILLPMEHKNEVFKLVFHGISSDFESRSKYKILLGDKTIKSGTIKSNDAESIVLKIDKEEYKNEAIWLVQNAGNIILKNGLSRDIGSVIKNSHSELKEFYDFDGDYYNQKRKLVGLCGASFLIKKEVVDKIGLFNNDFFMYYEDVDLGLRLWKSGWDIVYEPKSVVYHKHRATTNKETSTFFIKLIQKNHLIFLLLHFPLKQFVIKFIMFLLKTSVLLVILTMFKFLRYYGEKYKSTYIRATGRVESLKSFLESFKRTYKNRKWLKSNQKRSFSDLLKYLY